MTYKISTEKLFLPPKPLTSPTNLINSLMTVSLYIDFLLNCLVVHLKPLFPQSPLNNYTPRQIYQRQTFHHPFHPSHRCHSHHSHYLSLLKQSSPLSKNLHIYSLSPSNYRPISNLSIHSKILERVISSQLITYLTINKIPNIFQIAYLPTNLLSGINYNRGTILVLLDMSSAFYTLDHNRHHRHCLSSCVKSIHQLLTSNSLKLNPTKTEAIYLHLPLCSSTLLEPPSQSRTPHSPTLNTSETLVSILIPLFPLTHILYICTNPSTTTYTASA